jgi:hypothetical protein
MNLSRANTTPEQHAKGLEVSPVKGNKEQKTVKSYQCLISSLKRLTNVYHTVTDLAYVTNNSCAALAIQDRCTSRQLCASSVTSTEPGTSTSAIAQTKKMRRPGC